MYKMSKNKRRPCRVPDCKKYAAGCLTCLPTVFQWRVYYCSQECFINHLSTKENGAGFMKADRVKKYKFDIQDGELSVKNIAKAITTEDKTINVAGLYGDDLSNLTIIDYSGDEHKVSDLKIKSIMLQGDLFELLMGIGQKVEIDKTNEPVESFETKYKGK
jgi:hypothetical protein